MKNFQPRYIHILFAVVFVMLVSSLYFYYFKFDTEAKISKLMLLPNEKPVFATVTDKTKLQDQEFFKKAENGDEVLMFPENKKVILYRPSINRIIDVNILQVVEPTK
jgi:hypothetical protein